ASPRFMRFTSRPKPFPRLRKPARWFAPVRPPREIWATASCRLMNIRSTAFRSAWAPTATRRSIFWKMRELEYHLRLQKLERAVLDSQSQVSSLKSQALASYLFDCATINGARSIGAPNGLLEISKPADFFTVDLDDPSIAGASIDDLLAAIVFSLSRAAVCEVVIAGKPIVSEGQHLI